MFFPPAHLSFAAPFPFSCAASFEQDTGFLRDVSGVVSTLGSSFPYTPPFLATDVCALPLMMAFGCLGCFLFFFFFFFLFFFGFFFFFFFFLGGVSSAIGAEARSLSLLKFLSI